MRRLALSLVALLLFACDRPSVAPQLLPPNTGLEGELVSTTADGVERFTWRSDIPIDQYWSPTDFPCLTEPIHLTGVVHEYVDFFLKPSTGGHATIHQTTNDLNAVGAISGDTYSFSGPMTFTDNRAFDADVTEVEFTFHNMNHFVGHGSDPSLDQLQLIHITYDPSTGDTKVVVDNESIRCH